MTMKLPLVPFDALVAPMIEFNKIALGYSEKLIELNLAAARKNADVALAGWRDALAIKDPEGAREYLFRQSEVARGLVQEYVAEAKSINDLTQETATGMRKVVESNVAKVTQRA